MQSCNNLHTIKFDRYFQVQYRRTLSMRTMRNYKGRVLGRMWLDVAVTNKKHKWIKFASRMKVPRVGCLHQREKLSCIT
jgi:hypothetical protein